MALFLLENRDFLGFRVIFKVLLLLLLLPLLLPLLLLPIKYRPLLWIIVLAHVVQGKLCTGEVILYTRCD